MNSQHRRITRQTRLLVDEALHAVRRGFACDASGHRPVELRQLEQRLLMSATPAAVIADVPDAAAATDAPDSEDGFESQGSTTESDPTVRDDVSAAATNTDSDVQATVELVVIDPSAADYEQLVGDLQSQTDRAFEILVLNPRQDGISQITDALQNRTGVSAIHLVSHGDDGEILLGTSVLSQRNIDRYAAELITWQRSLTADADLLIYGCDLAASDSGTALTQSLNTLLGTDIAASDDLTGHASLGGDWDLEVGVGVIETAVAFTSELQGTWQSLLTLNAYEGFDYATGSLNGRNGGTGWASGWSTVASSAQVVETELTTPAGLPAGVGGAAELNTTLIFTQDRDLTTTLGADGTTAWFSFLLKADGTSGGLSLVIGDGAGADNTVNVGTSGNDFLISKDGSPTGEKISNAVVDEQTYFLAVQIDFTSGNDTVTLYLDPTAGETAPDSLPAATAQLTTADLGTFTQIGLLGGFADNNSQIDEIRVGTTFADVAGGTANVAPDLDLPSGPLNYNGGDPLTVIDGAATVADPDSGNFDTGQLTVAFTANSTSDDRLEIDTSGDFNLSGSDVRYQPGGPPTTIGTWTGGTDGSTPLVITFNTDATRAIVEDLVRSIGYRNVAASPSELSRTAEFQLTDNLGAASNTEVVTINMLGINAAPLNSVPGTQSTPVDTPLTFSTGNGNLISVSDPDAGAATVEVTLTATNGTVTVDLPFDVATATGPEFSLSSSSNGLQQDTQVARLPDGRFVVVWSGNGLGDSDGIWMRQFNADQTPVGSQMRLNGNGAKADPQSEPSVAVNDAGRIVVSWTSYDQDAALTDGVYFRALNWDGTSDTGEIAANTQTTGDQNESVVEIDAAGNVIVVWTDEDGLDGQNEGIFARRFDAAGTAIDATEWQVATTWWYKQTSATIAMNNSGQFVIAWQDSKADGQNEGVFAKRFDANANPLDAPGTPGEAEFQVNTTWLKDQDAPDVAIDDSGNFVVVWASEQQDASDDGIYGQLFDAAGNKVGPTEFQVHTTENWNQVAPTVAMNVSGDFIVAWEHYTAEFGPKDIRFQQFDSAANLVGTEQTANSPTTGQQNAPDVAMDATGNFVIVWDGQTTTETDGVIGRHYDVPLAPVTFSVGDGLADSTTTFQGTIASINGVLDGMIFTPTPTFVGTASVQIITDDLGNTGFGGSKLDDDTVNITVTAANTPIGAISDTNGAANTVAENATPGTAVGVTAFADDIDAGNTVSYSLDNDAGGLFEIHSTTGVVTVKTALDYETATSHNITVRATSTDSSTTTLGFTITVNAVNDNNPVITSDGGGASAAINVAENLTTVTTVTATDADLPGQTLSYSISGGADQLLFNIDSGTGVLEFNSAPDFEAPADAGADNVYDVQVQVSDGAGGTDTQSITVTVTDTNDNAPVITASQSFNVSEAAANGTALGSVTATDADAGTTFSNGTITAGNTDGIFAVNAATGQITVADNANLDFETTNSYTLSLTVSDGTNTSATETVAIAVTAANDNSPVFTSSGNLVIPENTPNLVTLTATDADLPAQSISFSIVGGDDAALMHIAAGNHLLMAPPADFETPRDADGDNVYEVQIQADDGNGRTSVQFLSVTITDVNDNIPVVTGGQIFNVSEIAPNGTALGTVTATDADADTTFSSWAITAGNADGIFAVNAATGALTVVDNTNLDIAVTSIYLLDITVSDGLNTSAARTVQVNVTPGPNTAPIAVPDSYTVSEGAILNVLAGSGVLSNDTDADGDSLTASLISSPAYASGFTLNADGSFTYQHNGSETTSDTFTYSVSDGTVAAMATVILTVTPVNDVPTLTAFADVTIPEDTAFGPVTFTVGDSETASTSLLVTATSSVQSLIANSGIVVSGSGAGRTLSFTPVSDATGGPATITVSVSDGVSSTSTTFDVSITAVKIAPTLPVAGPPVTDSSTESNQTPTDSNPQSNSSDSDNSSTLTIVAAAATPSSKDSDDDDAIPPPVQHNSNDHTAEFVPVAQIVGEVSADPVVLDQIVVAELDFDRVRASSLKTVAQHATATVQHSITVDTTGNFSNSAHLTYQDFSELKETAGRIDEFQENLKSEYRLTDMTASTVAVAGTSIVIGTVVTALRTGMLALGFLSQLPVWTLFDPLLVMDGVSGGDDGDSLQDIIDRQVAAQQD